MKHLAKKIIRIVLPIAILLISIQVLAQEQPQGDQTSDPRQELPAVAPDLADIVPLMAELTGRLASLESRVKGLLDVSEVEKNFAGIEVSLKDPAGQFRQLKDAKDYQYNKLVELREVIKRQNKLFAEISKPLKQAIGQLGAWRKEWLTEKQRWAEWRISLGEEGEFDLLEPTFKKANDTIDRALGLILPQLEAMLRVQEKAGNIHAKINAFDAELGGLITDKKRDALLYASPAMFSSEYYSQFESGLWFAVKKGLDDVSWPGRLFFARLGWIVFLHALLVLIITIVVYRKRQVLNESERWRFLSARPLAAGLFLGYMVALWFYEIEAAPTIWKLANMVVGLTSFARLSGNLIEAAWKRHFVYGLMAVLIATGLMNALNFPLPLFRLYTVIAALAGLFMCVRWSRESDRHKDPRFYIWFLRSGALFFTFIIVAEFWGQKGLASHIFISLVDSIATVLIFMLFAYLLHGGLEWLVRASPLRRVPVFYRDSDALVHRVAFLINAALGGLILLPGILMIWGFYDNLEEATKGLLALGFNLGSQRISVGLLLLTAGIIYGSLLASWILRKLLMNEMLIKRQFEKGVRFSIGRLVHYVIMLVGFLVALSVLGFEITKLTIMLSALGVGIGFGLQGVVNNFVSGLILLFERPVRVGDFIEIGDKWAEIKKIGMRATIVQTFDQADVIIPNADLINNQVTNWTLSNRLVRLCVPVGVAYGSDVPLVMEKLMACALANSMVAKKPVAKVLFLSFGESSLDFELRVWVMDAEHRLDVRSELHQAIDRSFREAKIEIAFPQRDLHLFNGDSIIERVLPNTNEAIETE